MSPVRVLIVEDQTTFREMLVELLRADPRYVVIAQLGLGTEAIATADQEQPDMAIVDVVLPDMNGLDVVRHLVKRHPRTKILIVTAQTKAQVVNEAYHTGAHGIVSKNASLFDLRAGMQRIADGENYHCPTTQAILHQPTLQPMPSGHLSARERQIVQLVAQGKSSREIAADLDLSPKTVANHRHRISKKLDIHEVAGLTRYAIQRGWIDGDG